MFIKGTNKQRNKQLKIDILIHCSLFNPLHLYNYLARMLLLQTCQPVIVAKKRSGLAALSGWLVCVLALCVFERKGLEPLTAPGHPPSVLRAGTCTAAVGSGPASSWLPPALVLSSTSPPEQQ